MTCIEFVFVVQTGAGSTATPVLPGSLKGQVTLQGERRACVQERDLWSLE